LKVNKNILQVYSNVSMRHLY